MFRFTIRDVLLVMVIVAPAVAWWVECKSCMSGKRWQSF